MAQLESMAAMRRARSRFVRDETLGHASASAVVFAPHPDDETLGCGGTILLKREAGTPVSVVFMTDGCGSHRRLMPEARLRQLRKDEALEAAGVLGVATADVHFLDLEDGGLSRCQEAAVAPVLALLEQLRPEEVFVTSRHDGTADHEATYRIVMEAVRRSGRSLRICEYPVWLWNQWPWVPLPLRCNRDLLRAIGRILRAGGGLAPCVRFRSGVRIREVHPRKREALARHRSQMTELIADVSWPTLPAISGGEFLELFFQDAEVFRCTVMPARQPPEAPCERRV